MPKRYNGSFNIVLKMDKVRDDICMFCCLEEEICRRNLRNKYPNNKLFLDETILSFRISNIQVIRAGSPMKFDTYYASNCNCNEYLGKISDLTYLCDSIKLNIIYSSDDSMEIPDLIMDFFKGKFIDGHNQIIGEEEDYESSKRIGIEIFLKN